MGPMGNVQPQLITPTQSDSLDVLAFCWVPHLPIWEVEEVIINIKEVVHLAILGGSSPDILVEMLLIDDHLEMCLWRRPT